MLSKKDLVHHEVFFKGTDNNFYSHCGDYVITFEANRTYLRAHCEVKGILEPIKELMSLEDLNETIKILNI